MPGVTKCNVVKEKVLFLDAAAANTVTDDTQCRSFDVNEKNARLTDC